MWNPFEAIKRKITGDSTPPEARTKNGAGDAAALTLAAQEAAEAGVGPGSAPMAEFEKKGLLSKFYRHWKDPALLKQMKVIVTRMQSEGINVKDKSAVQAWLKEHQKEIESGQLADVPAAAKPQTYVKTAPEIGRNDPCRCGSGKKYKKCCGTKA